MFNYHCEECKKGIVRPKRVKNYRTQFSGYPFIVDKAVIGVCDHCKAQYFSAKERKRWKELYENSLSAQGKFLTPEEIAQLRNQLGLSLEAFANLLGCTRQSVYNWEKKTRSSPPSKTADILMRLIRESYAQGPVNVLEFVTGEARKMGASITVKNIDWESSKRWAKQIADEGVPLSDKIIAWRQERQNRQYVFLE